MAKDIVQRFRFEARSATETLKKLTESLAQYNEKVKQVNNSLDQQRQQYAFTATSLKAMRERVTRAKDALRDLVPAVDRATRSFHASATIIDGSTTAFQQFRTNLVGTNANLALTGATLGRFVSRVSQLNASLQRELGIVANTANTFTRFNDELHRATNLMARKNRLLIAQTAATNNDNNAVRRGISFFGLYGDSIRSVIGQVFIATAAHRTFLRSIQGVIDGITKAKDFDLNIREIETLARNNAVATEEWKNQLRGLSAQFGVSQFDAAEASYQSLSNQVVSATQVQRFLREEIKLSVLAVSSLSAAVNATSSIINAFGYEQSQAAYINSILFATIDKGRLRLEDIADSIGRVSILSDQLNISYVEQQTAIALLTNKGIDAAEAMTLLRGIQLKMIRPTEEMAKFFGTLGVTSGAAAIKTYGFVNVLNLLFQAAEKSGDKVSFLGEAFGRVRATIGALGISQTDYNQKIRELEQAASESGEALDKSLTGLGRRAEIQLQKLRVQFERTGETVLSSLVGVAEATGGADVLLKNAGSSLYGIINAYVIYRTTVYAASFATYTFNASVGLQVAVLRLQHGQVLRSIAALTGLRVATIELGLAFGGVTLGVMLLVSKAIYEQIGFTNRLADAQQRGSEATRVIAEQNERLYKGLEDKLARPFDLAGKALENYGKILSQVTAIAQLKVTSMSSDFEKAFKDINTIIKTTTKDVLSDFGKALDKTIREAERSLSAIEDRRKASRDRAFESSFESRVTDIDTKTEEKKLEELTAYRKKLAAGAIAFIAKGEVDSAQTVYAKVDDLNNRIKQSAITNEKEKLEKEKETIDFKIAKEKFAENEKKRIAEVRKSEEFRRLNQETAALQKRFQKTGDLSIRDEIIRKFDQQQKLVEPKKFDDKVDKVLEGRTNRVLLEIDKERAAIVKDRIAAEEAFNKREEARATTEKKKAELQSRAFEVFKRTLTELDTFNPKDGIGRFDTLIKQIQDTGKKAGIDPLELVKLLRENQKQRLTLVKAEEVRVAQERVEAYRKTLEDQTTLLEEELKKRANLERQRPGFTSAGVQLGQGRLVELEELSKRLRERVGDGPVIQGRKTDVFDETQQTKEFRDQITAAQIALNNVNQVQANGGEGLLEAVKRYEEAIANLNKTADKLGPLGEKIGFVNGIKPVKEGLIGGKTIKDRLLDIGSVFDDLKKNVEETNKLNESTDKIRTALIGLRKEVQALPPEILKMTEQFKISTETVEQRVTRLTAAVRGLAAEMTRIINIPVPGGVPQQRNFGGPIRRFNFGVQGTDTQLALHTPGESVITRQASKTFAPLIAAMNASTPSLRSSGDNFTFGDINIYGQTKDPITTEQLARELDRLARTRRKS